MFASKYILLASFSTSKVVSSVLSQPKTWLKVSKANQNSHMQNLHLSTKKTLITMLSIRPSLTVSNRAKLHGTRKGFRR